jgi:Protein of unknown function (DUF3102)
MMLAPLTNTRDWKWHRDRIAATWGKQVESIIETGQALIEAKDELKHGSFEAMIQTTLPFQASTAQNLMKIARNPVLSKAEHARLLPPSWTILYELTKLPFEVLTAKLKDGSIHPKLERKDVRAMRPNIKKKPKPATREEVIAAIQASPNANQRDAASALNISLGLYQRTRNELIGSGEIKGALTVDDLCERMVTLLRDKSTTDRIAFVHTLMMQLGLSSEQLSPISTVVADFKPTIPDRLIWRRDPKRGLGTHRAYTAYDYSVSPGYQLMSGKVTYSVFQGEQPELGDRRYVGSAPTLDKAKALAEQDCEQRKQQTVE